MKIQSVYLDCNGVVSIGLKISYCANLIIENVTVSNALEKAFYCVNGYELFMANCYAKNESEISGIIGYFISCTDSVFTNCISKNFAIGFYTDEGSVKFNGCHPWNNLEYYKANSIGFQTYNNPTFDNCEIDTCTIGVDVHEYYNVWFNNCYFMFNAPNVANDVYYIYLATSTRIFMTNCYMRSITTGGNHYVTNKPNSLECVSTIIIENVNSPRVKNSVPTLDLLFNLVIANGTAVTVAAQSKVIKTFTVSEVRQGDLLITSVMYDATGLMFKPTVTENGKVTVVITNPTTSSISTSWCTIHLAIIRDTTINLSYTNVDAD